MRISPKTGQRIKFKQTGEKEEKTDVVQSVLSPKFRRGQSRTEYLVICDDNNEKVLLDSLS